MRLALVLLSVLLSLLQIASTNAQQPGSNYKDFLLKNIIINGTLPRSFAIEPPDYFTTLPPSELPNHYTHDEYIAPCGGNVSAKNMNNYMFQTEVWLTRLGLNIYDGAVRCVALSILGEAQVCLNYTNFNLVGHRTAQFMDIRGDAPCRGVMEWDQCTDPEQTGACGFCYGDTADKTLTSSNAYFFRMISDFWAIEGTIDERCPERKMMWTWNDYKPVLGENAWANFIGPVHNAMFRYNNKYDSVPDDDPAFTLGIAFLQALDAMAVGSTGAYYYTPRNTWFGFNAQAQNIGSTLSVENQASLLAGLKLLYALISGKSNSQHAHHLPGIDARIKSLTQFILSAFDVGRGFFRQGATYNATTNTLTWGQDGQPIFAVDCQTWVSSVLGTPLIDQTFGAGTAYTLWGLVKQYANYSCPNGELCGVGYTFSNYSGQVLSGEWTYGAMNWLNIMMNESGYNSTEIQQLQSDFQNMNYGTYSYVVVSTSINNSTEQYDSVMYAGQRYYIPFGWYANAIPAVASTGWAVFVENNFNPFHIMGTLESVFRASEVPEIVRTFKTSNRTWKSV